MTSVARSIVKSVLSREQMDGAGARGMNLTDLFKHLNSLPSFYFLFFI
jgi:hypothetical protein